MAAAAQAVASRSTPVAGTQDEDPRGSPPPNILDAAAPTAETPAAAVDRTNVIVIDSMDVIAEASLSLRKWVGSVVGVEASDGARATGRLTGVNGLTIVVAHDDGTNFSESLANLRKITKLN